MARERRHVRHVAEPSSETRRHTNTSYTRPAAQAPLISFQQAWERPPTPPALTRANEARLPPGLPPGPRHSPVVLNDRRASPPT
ncbi:BQ5605_C002g01450 [Microbotryum silenes-dioicae]|uniref:BQ5605_C002g01450 protein n=1 Tax=Microbotryum silenes-dioicae TaxID=796604 RepID=A0A2X0M385_9BASI|nr:BQ5605_C002g01450 [Microbotryum silenes-dioicae]